MAAMLALLAACDAPENGASVRPDPATTEADAPRNGVPARRDPADTEPDSPLRAGAETAPSHSIAAGYLAEARFAQADFERGELLSYACIVCHTLGPGEEHLAGPNLYGVFGRPAASAPGFQYSVALQEAGITWTPAELDAWLARPDDFVPGNLMVFAGIYSDSDRTDLLAYLLRETAVEEPAAPQ